VVNRGDAVFHVARAEQPQDAAAPHAEQLSPLFDEDEII
jgi:hypothetical protein